MDVSYPAWVVDQIPCPTIKAGVKVVVASISLCRFGTKVLFGGLFPFGVELLGIKIEEDLRCDTLAGLILHLLGRFPETGERVTWQDYLLTCVEATPTTIRRVKIEKCEKN